MVLPSKELLSSVLGKEKEDILSIRIVNNELQYYYKSLYRLGCNLKISKHKDSIIISINIYELMHMMKEWAISKKVYILSNISFIGGTAHTIKGNENNLFSANTEFEAVTKACEWILEQQK